MSLLYYILQSNKIFCFVDINYERAHIYHYLPIKSVGIFPLQNLPVGSCVVKSIPYGKKLDLVIVGKLLLFPGSKIESPKARRAGSIGLFGVFRFWSKLRVWTMQCCMANRKENVKTVKRFIATARLCFLLV
jgi:hypothetical protein